MFRRSPEIFTAIFTISTQKLLKDDQVVLLLVKLDWIES